MPRRIDSAWIVFDSVENDQHDRCVDLFQRTDGSWGFEEFRRDAEDAGAWTPVRYFSAGRHPSRDAAWDAARARVTWLTRDR